MCRGRRRGLPSTGPGSTARSAGSFDPRLLHYARATRAYLILSIAVGGAAALLVIAQAWLIATIVAGAFVDHRGVASLRAPVIAFVAVVAGRALLAWAAERAAFRASASAKSDLRLAAAGRVAALGPAGLDRRDTGQLTVLLTTGIDALDGYFSRYLPQVFLAVIVPVAIIGVVAGADWVSAVLIAVSVPLIPIFMALVGATTRDRTATRLRALHKLAGHFLDVVAGLPTLKVFGRAKAQARSIAEVTDRYRSATMGTLRLTFLSSLVLELLATVSVALVAVAVGLRLLGGSMGFHDALFVLVLAPEAYLPLRALGTHFHASADGLKAAEEIFDLIEEPDQSPSVGRVRAAGSGIVVAGLEVTYPSRRIPAVHDFDLVVEAGETVALTGPSGCGKSTVLSVVLGLLRPDAGTVRLGGVDLAEVDLDDWRRHLAWVPQRPHLFARSVAENVRLGRPDASDAHVAAALDAAGLTEVVRHLPHGVDTRLGEGGAGLSAGRAPAPRPGPRLRAQRAPARAGRADGEPGQRDAGGRAGRHPGADQRPHRADRGPPPGAGGVGRPGRGTAAAPGPCGSLERRQRSGGRMSDHPAGTLRTLGVARRARRRLTQASLLGAGAIGASIALMATSAWLISRAAQHPAEASLTLAIVGVQFFGLSRGFLRYGERLVGHDAALRVLSDLRVRVYERLEAVAPAGLPLFRRGDLVARVVNDVDSLQDVVLRVIEPFAVAALVGTATVAAMWWFLPQAGLVLFVALLLSATAVPWLTGRLATREEARQATVRGELAAEVVDLVAGTPELVVMGGTDAQLARIGRADQRLRSLARRGAGTAGIGLGLTTALAGLASWGALTLGVRATHGGSLNGALLAVLALVPLAAVELVAPLPAATQALQRSRVAAGRVFAAMDATAVVSEPRRPLPLTAGDGPHTVALRSVWASYPGAGRAALRGVDLTLGPGRRVALVGPSGAGKSTIADVLVRFLPADAGEATLDDVPLERFAADDVRRIVGLVEQRPHFFDTTLAANLRIGRPRRATPSWRRSSSGSGWADGGAASPMASRPRSARWARVSRAGSARGSPWRGPCWPTFPSWCSTSPQNIWNRRPPTI